MIAKDFVVRNGKLHFPIKSRREDGFVVGVYADSEKRAEFYIPLALKGEKIDFYAPFDISRFSADTVTLISEESDNETLFDSILQGEGVGLYPELYNEYHRQQIHYSPARGWVNDPNGLFCKDGVFNLYYQHNIFENIHAGVNISWGHAITEDGVHYKELPDAILPHDADYIVASGSAIVDENNLSGFGKDTIIAAYTRLIAGRVYILGKDVYTGEGQIVCCSTDGGMTYKPITDGLTIPAPDRTYWRDPKLFKIDESTLGMAVYETFEGENCVSFYKSNNCRNWEFCSRNMDLYECPDLFCLDVEETGEKLWGLYGGNGKYRVGTFENFVFSPLGNEGYLDYGDKVYAGQTYNNYPSDKKRLFTAWLREEDDRDAVDETGRRVGFSQSMSLMSELSIHKTKHGYRIFRKPIDKISTLRKTCEEVLLNGKIEVLCPGEIEFKVNSDIKFIANDILFCYNAKERKITSVSGKEYELCSENDFNVRIIFDTNSVEICVADEIVMSFFKDVKKTQFEFVSDSEITGKIYKYESIWKR